MSLKDDGRKKKIKYQKPRKRVKCPLCNYDFGVTENDYDYVEGIVFYYCVNCGEEFVEGMKVK